MKISRIAHAIAAAAMAVGLIAAGATAVTPHPSTGTSSVSDTGWG